MKILSNLTFLQSRKKRDSLVHAKSIFLKITFVIAACFLLTQPTNLRADEVGEKWVKENLNFLTEKDTYKRYLKNPIFETKEFKQSPEKKQKEVRKQLFLDTKYSVFKRKQRVIFMRSVVGLGLIVLFSIFIPLMRYLAQKDPKTFWKIIEKTGLLTRENYMEKLETIGIIGSGLGALAKFSLNSSFFVDQERRFYFSDMEIIQRPPLEERERKITAGIQNSTSVLESFLFYVIFKFLLGVPETFTQSIVLIAWPAISVPFFLPYFLYFYFIPRVKKPFLLLWYGKNELFVDPMEELELLYIEKQDELSEELQDKVIEPMLFEARRFSENQVHLKAFLEEVLYLPTRKQTTSIVKSLPKKPDLSKFQDYDRYVQDEVRLLYHRSRERRKMEPILLEGPAGTGKSHLVHAFADLVNAEIAMIFLTGNTRKDIMGEAGNGRDPGNIGLLAEALSNASKRAIENGKDSLILFFEEGGQALQSEYKEEIEQLLLEILESSTASFKSPALGDYDIPLPVIIIITSNHKIEGALANRLTPIKIEKVAWKVKKKLLQRKENMDKYCKKVGFDPKNLTQQHKKDIAKILEEMEKEDPDSEKDPGLRQAILRIEQYLEYKQYEEELEEMKRIFEKAKGKN
ncbi:MAG: AAA family ATPase [Bacteroidota bacterium]